MMADTAQRALRMIDESVHACRSQAQLQEGRVVVAVGHLTAGALLPACSPAFQRRTRSWWPRCTTAMPRRWWRRCSRASRFGAGLRHRPDAPELATERLFSERMALFLRHDHPLAHAPACKGATWTACPWCM